MGTINTSNNDGVENTTNIPTPKPSLPGEHEGITIVANAILAETTPPSHASPIKSASTEPPPESQKTDFVAKAVIGNQMAKVEVALLAKVISMPQAGKQARENERINKAAAKEDRQQDRIDKREAKLDRRDARQLLGDQLYFDLLKDLLDKEIVATEVEYDLVLNKMLMNETFYNNMDNLLEGRIERDLLGKTAVTDDD